MRIVASSESLELAHEACLNRFIGCGRVAILGGRMQLVLIYAAGAVLAAAMAWFSGPGTSTAVQWLYIAGAVLFAIAALGQFFKQSQPPKR